MRRLSLYVPFNANIAVIFIISKSWKQPRCPKKKMKILELFYIYVDLFNVCLIKDNWIIISDFALSLSWYHLSYSVEKIPLVRESELKRQIMNYFENSFDLMYPLKGSQGPQGVLGSHFANPYSMRKKICTWKEKNGNIGSIFQLTKKRDLRFLGEL